MSLNVVDPINEKISMSNCLENYDKDTFISPPWIDFHTHIYHGMTSFGLKPDDIGYKKGVHLLVDAGSAGVETIEGFKQYIIPRYKTKIRAFLNISSIGLVTMREFNDFRNLNPYNTARCILANKDILIGVKVRSSDTILEGRGLSPLKLAIEAAEIAGCPVMIHMGENPPSNEDNLKQLRKGDIISHCFHGKKEPLWLPEGLPIPALEDVLKHGIFLDVAHGAASFDIDIARNAILNGYKDFIISTDLHLRNVNGPVFNLAQTMSKFYSLGMNLVDVIDCVTRKPAMILGLKGWCDDLTKNSTIFKIRDKTEQDLPFYDSSNKYIDVKKVIDPIAVIIDGEFIDISNNKGEI